MVHPHDLFDKSEPWTIRIKNIAKEFIKSSHQVKLCYFPLALNERCHPSVLDFIELVPLDRIPSPRTFISNTKKLIQLCKWADIVHFQKCHHYASIPATIAAYIAGKPLHYDWDDWEEKIWYESCGRGIHSRFIGLSFKLLERWLPVLVDSVSCASSHLKALTQAFGIKNEFIFNTPVGADLDKFRPGLDGAKIKEKYSINSDLVLYIGQLHGAQYVDLLIRASNIVLHKKPETKFMIVGEGFLESKLRALVYDLGLVDKVIFTSSVPHEEIPYYINAASVCVAPFRHTEVTICKSPLKIVEYMACGKAIVASNVGEVKNMLGGVGILTEPDDHHSLAQGILKLLQDDVLRDKLGRCARKRLENKYNWRNTASSLLSAYQGICKA